MTCGASQWQQPVTASIAKFAIPICRRSFKLLNEIINHIDKHTMLTIVTSIIVEHTFTFDHELHMQIAVVNTDIRFIDTQS